MSKPEAYKGYTLQCVNTYQRAVSLKKRDKKVSYWQIIKEGRVLDTALTRTVARKRVNFFLESRGAAAA